MPEQSDHSPPLKRSDDGRLIYNRPAMLALLEKLVAATGGHEFDLNVSREDAEGLRTKGKEITEKEIDGETRYFNKYLIEANPPESKPKDIFVPDSDMVVRAKNCKLQDPYLSGLVEGENKTFVDPRQYTVFQADKVESASPDAYRKPMALYKKADGKAPTVRDLVVFKPERMALHWTAILTSMFVRTTVKSPENPNTPKMGEWIDKRDAEYVAQVNELYAKLFGIDRRLQKEPPITPWSGSVERLEAIKTICEHQRAIINEAVDQAAKEEPISSQELSATEKSELSERVAAVCSSAKASDKKRVTETSLQCVKDEWYRQRANDAISKQMEQWFKDIVFKKGSGYAQKKYQPSADRESFVLSGGSATGKSVPMAMLLAKLARGYNKEDDHEKTPWKKSGLDLNDAVHMKSEVMRSLLIEPEFLQYGNRIFYDESAHDERAIIRGEMFKYLDRMLNNKEASPLRSEGTGPIIIHDRRSTFPRETEILTADKAKLNYYYFNVPVKVALERNRLRGISDFQRLLASDMNGKDIDAQMQSYVARLVNARNNIHSQRRSAERMMEMLENFAGQDICLPLYSTNVERDVEPRLIGYADLKERVLHIHNLPRLLDALDNRRFHIGEDHRTHAGPLPVSDADELAQRHNAHSSKTDKESRDIENAIHAAEWVANLAQHHRYQIFISTPSKEPKSSQPNTLFAEVRPPEKIDTLPSIIKTDEQILSAVRKPRAHSEPAASKHAPEPKSRYGAFFDKLESLTQTQARRGFESTTDLTSRIKPLHIGRSHSNYVTSRRSQISEGPTP